MVDIARITEIVEPEARALGFDLVRVRFFGKAEVGDEEGALQIMAERPETGQLIIDDCAALSRRISDIIDTLEEEGEVLIPGMYRLEVSSPGIDRPLTRYKDFVNWTGHEARVQLTVPVDGNRKALNGQLVSVEGDVIAFDERKSGRVTFPYENVESARLILTDKLIAATRPIVMDGADDIVEEQED